ncbi:tripartite tricarboxylate transporter substrate binding protein [Cupriavidus sp. BIC8F]|uniref:Bug family tripartite tricarboxylate transporter substrate binding protein n=1 Tax=Cupriavidus sp. BIC8F TaxID=3079014 RepID=UPI002915F157|nr:tripartite tricarboxylate transporter substrate binding protein [Cupriavidus sp. BIC8F]
MRLTTAFKALALSAACCFSAFAQAADPWPHKPVTVIVASAAGGSADVLTRIVLTHLAKETNASFVVDNRPGAAGNIGMAQVKRAAPDGYTLGYGNINTLAINPALFTRLPYDVRQDFVPVGQMFSIYNLLVVRADSPVKNVAELLALAKKSPGKLSYAAAGTGSSGHMGGELLKKMAGVDVLFIPYNGDPASLTDLAGGRLDYTITNASVAWPLIKSGKLRALAITSRERVALYPNVPTLNESGLKGYENVSWGGLVVPKGTPQPIVDKLGTALEKVLKSDQLRQDLSNANAVAATATREEFVRFIASEQKKWAALVESAKIPKQN